MQTGAENNSLLVSAHDMGGRKPCFRRGVVTAHSNRTRRCYCLLPDGATGEDLHLPQFHCGVGGHSHLNFVELYGVVEFIEASRQIQRHGAAYQGSDGMLAREEVEWLSFPRVVRLRYEPKTKKHQRIQFNDLSAQVGAFLAEAVRHSPPGTWPHVLLATIQKRRDPPRDSEIRN